MRLALLGTWFCRVPGFGLGIHRIGSEDPDLMELRSRRGLDLSSFVRFDDTMTKPAKLKFEEAVCLWWTAFSVLRIAIAKRWVVFAAVLAFAGVMVSSNTTHAQAPKLEDLTIVSASSGATGSKSHKFKVELALTDEAQRLGLMYRSQLGADRGMLFIYRPAQEITMWMRNTRLSLDMIFIRGDGVIHRIATDAEPYSLDTIASQGNVVAVLEVLAGTARRLGLKAGDKVVSKTLGTGR